MVKNILLLLTVSTTIQMYSMEGQRGKDQNKQEEKEQQTLIHEAHKRTRDAYRKRLCERVHNDQNGAQALGIKIQYYDDTRKNSGTLSEIVTSDSTVFNLKENLKIRNIIKSTDHVILLDDTTNPKRDDVTCSNHLTLGALVAERKNNVFMVARDDRHVPFDERFPTQ